MKHRRVTSQDVAMRAGVSRTTVSLVLNNVSDNRISADTVQRVLRAARELDYIPDNAARDLASRCGQSMGLVFSRHASLMSCDNFLAQSLQALVEVARENGMRLVLDAMEDLNSPEGAPEWARSLRVDGLLLSGLDTDAQALAALETTHLPVVLIGRAPGSDFPSVSLDDTQAAQSVTAHLIGLGHTRIACITQAPQASSAASCRLQGYRQALEDAGLPYNENLVRTGAFSPETGYVQMSDLLELPDRPSAVFASADILALGALSALQEDGLNVPNEVALAGFGDIPLAAYSAPPLTSVRIPADEIARQAGRMLAQLVRGEQPAERHLLLQGQLAVRASTQV